MQTKNIVMLTQAFHRKSARTRDDTAALERRLRRMSLGTKGSDSSSETCAALVTPMAPVVKMKKNTKADLKDVDEAGGGQTPLKTDRSRSRRDGNNKLGPARHLEVPEEDGAVTKVLRPTTWLDVVECSKATAAVASSFTDDAWAQVARAQGSGCQSPRGRQFLEDRERPARRPQGLHHTILLLGPRRVQRRVWTPEPSTPERDHRVWAHDWSRLRMTLGFKEKAKEKGGRSSRRSKCPGPGPKEPWAEERRLTSGEKRLKQGRGTDHLLEQTRINFLAELR